MHANGGHSLCQDDRQFPFLLAAGIVNPFFLPKTVKRVFYNF
ncbi:hypothetical protein HM1_1612 [Heliomicrobium modesticaldum Ice1]|uniref:Uncharacterized protein n=1 Tax=Heliobacterium modesticaldum (strain ATCC 51547 / Ice1) TaxID=498761 RepID=B0TDE1_HELMI|nr:hypothetical protein HM1_1612 [Heliomicrobium modesticaldum Ice1]